MALKGVHEFVFQGEIIFLPIYNIHLQSVADWLNKNVFG